jgi:DNA polymerase III alpha subunit (gram-positive type)
MRILFSIFIIYWSGLVWHSLVWSQMHSLIQSIIFHHLHIMTGYICILDFEATCWDNSRDHEIIEFPSVLLKWNDDNEITIVDEFQIFVKPKKYPVVSEFCRKLTGITQEIVNKGTDL